VLRNARAARRSRTADRIACRGAPRYTGSRRAAV